MFASDNFTGAVLGDGDHSLNPLLKAAVESANDAIIITEVELEEPGPRMEYVNPAFERMTGYSYADVVGKSPRLLQGPATDRELLRRLKDDLQNRRSFHGETINYRKDGSEYHVEWRITPLFNESGGIEKWVAIQRDVTSRVRAEQERDRLLESERAARAHAERQSQMKDDFLATLSHELRTPLNAIVGWSHILSKSPDASADVRDGLTVIARNAKAQSQIIEDLLDMSRVISGQLRLDVQAVNLGEVIDAGIDAVGHAAAAKGVTILRAVDERAGPVSGDPARLRQIVWNLLSNAVKFTPAGGWVKVSLERTDSHVELAVRDNGMGIRPDFLPHVFDRFRQQDASTTRKYGGLGIGLAIVKHLVELHGGIVRAKSAGENLGTTFTVSLPATPPPAATAKPGEPAEDPADVDECAPQLNGLRVLVVDDEPDGRHLIERLLTDCRAVVTPAATGSEALSLLGRQRFDVLVSDIGMANVDGYALIRAVRQMTDVGGDKMPALAVTAFAQPADRRRCLVAGYDMHIAKPVDAGELLALVARAAARIER